MKEYKFTQAQQQQFATRLDEELHKMTMSWDNELREWHALAIDALDFASPVGLRIPEDKFIELFEVEKQGVNMNIVAVLINSMRSRNASQMKMSGIQWAKCLQLNASIQKRWNALVAPLEQSLLKEVEIMGNKPKLVVAGNA